MGDPYPTVLRWLEGAPDEHPWVPLLANGDDFAAALLGALETILSTVKAAEPDNLAEKRKKFANDYVNGHDLDLRLELLVAYRLAKANVRFDFGGKGEPDICCSVGRPLWLEVTSRTKDDLVIFREELETALVDHYSGLVFLRVPKRPLSIPAHDRLSMIRRVCEAATDVESSRTVRLPEVNGRVSFTGVRPLGPSRVQIEVADPVLADHMADLERAFHGKVADKAEQATRGGWNADDTLLFVDTSRLGVAFLRPDSVWAEVVQQMELDWNRIPFAGLVIMLSALDHTRLGGACLLSPNLADDAVIAWEQLLAKIGFGSLQS